MEKVKAYFKRIGLDYPEKITLDSELLRKLQFAHCTHVPYENLDIIRGIPLSLKADDLYNKVVVQGKGGFCFELNGLFGWLLRELGYEVTDVAARYLRGESSIPMRRHRVLIVRAADGLWCCDVGIGEVCPRYPLRLEEGLEQPQFDECYRFDKDPKFNYPNINAKASHGILPIDAQFHTDLFPDLFLKESVVVFHHHQMNSLKDTGTAFHILHQ